MVSPYLYREFVIRHVKQLQGDYYNAANLGYVRSLGIEARRFMTLWNRNLHGALQQALSRMPRLERFK